MTAPFRPGDHILHREHPREAWTVVSCEPHPRGQWRVVCALDGCTEKRMAGCYVLAPAGWYAPPSYPTGAAALGLDEEARRQKERNDAADPAHQLALLSFGTALLIWADRCLYRLDPAAAEAEIASANLVMARASARLRGEDPDATAASVERAA